MKIGILTEIVNFSSGARAPLEIARHLSRRKHRVTVYATTNELDRLAKKNLQADGVKVILIGKPHIPGGKFLVFPKLFFVLKQDEPDIFTFSGRPPFFFAGWATGIPVVRIYQGTQFDALLEYEVPGKQVPAWKKILNLIANVYIYLVDFSSFRLSRAVVAISHFSAREGEILYKRQVEKIIYHGTTILPYAASQQISQMVNFLSVSRLTPYKGFHLIIAALKKVKTQKKIRLTLAGSQPKWGYLDFLQKLAGDRISLQILINPTDQRLAQLYKKTYCYLTADRYLYFGMPVVEAASFGVPTIAFNFAAAGEIVAHGKTGYIVTDEAEFVKYVQKILNRPLRDRLGQAAKHFVARNFTWQKAAGQYEEMLQKILNYDHTQI